MHGHAPRESSWRLSLQCIRTKPLVIRARRGVAQTDSFDSFAAQSPPRPGPKLRLVADLVHWQALPPPLPLKLVSNSISLLLTRSPSDLHEIGIARVHCPTRKRSETSSDHAAGGQASGRRPCGKRCGRGGARRRFEGARRMGSHWKCSNR